MAPRLLYYAQLRTIGANRDFFDDLRQSGISARMDGDIRDKQVLLLWSASTLPSGS